MINKLVEHIFEFQRLNDKVRDYLISDGYDEDRENNYPRNERGIDYISFDNYDFLKKYFSNIDTLGKYEMALLDVMLNSPQQVNLIWGAIGSGKTATCQFLNEFIPENIKEGNKLNHIYIDFIEFVESKIIEKTKGKVTREEVNNSLVFDEVILFLSDQFYNDITKNIDENEFVGFWNAAIGYANKSRLIEIMKINDLIDARTKRSINLKKEIIELLIKNEKIPPTFKFKFWMFLLYCYGEYKNKNIVLTIDNLDTLLPELQNNVVRSFAGYFNVCPKVKLLIPIRLMNVKNVESAFTYNRITHSCLLPMKIIKARLDHFIRNIENEERFSNFATEQSKVDTFIRAIEIKIYLSNDKEDIYKFCSSVGGYSARRILHLAQNLFKNLKDDLVPEEEPQRNMILNISELKDDDNCKKLINMDDIYNDIKKLSELSNKLLTKTDTKELSEEEKLINKKINWEIYDIIKKNEELTKNILQSLNYSPKKRDINFCKLLIIDFKEKTSNEFRYVEDVFHFLYKDNLSLLKIRIMFSLSHLNRFMKVKELLDLLKIFEYSDYEIENSINSLLTFDKRILWMDGNTSIKNYKELYDEYGEYYIGLTKSGELYCSELIYLSIYVEKMLLYNLNTTSIAERIEDVFDKCMKFFDEELKEYDAVYEKLKKGTKKDIKYNEIAKNYLERVKNIGFLTSEIVDRMFYSELEILRAHKKRLQDNSSPIEVKVILEPIISNIKNVLGQFGLKSKERNVAIPKFERHYNFIRKEFS